MWREPLDRLSSGYVTLDSSTDVAGLEQELREAGWFVAHCDCGSAIDKASLINAIAIGLRFPEWTGRNWDALNDSLTDLGWLDDSMIAVVLDGFTSLRSAEPATYQTARDVLVDAAEWWSSHEKTLIVLST